MTIDTELDRLRSLAKQATAGPWQFSAFDEWYEFQSGVKTEAIVSGVDGKPPVAECSPSDAAYIAACDPQTILALIAEVEALRNGIGELLAYVQYEEGQTNPASFAMDDGQGNMVATAGSGHMHSYLVKLIERTKQLLKDYQ